MGYLVSMTIGSQLLDASLAAFLQSTEMLWAYVLQVLLFHEEPSVLTVAGVFCILVAVALIAWNQSRAGAAGTFSGARALPVASPTFSVRALHLTEGERGRSGSAIMGLLPALPARQASSCTSSASTTTLGELGD